MSDLLTYIFSHEDSFQRRLPSLYSDFALQRHTNPDGYATNIATWQKALAHAALAGLIPSNSRGSDRTGTTSKPYKSNLLVLSTGSTLTAALETARGERPVALQSVIDESLRSGNMIPLQEFLNSQTSPFRRGWIRLPAPPSLYQILSWSARQARGLVIGSDGDQFEASHLLQTNDLVLVENLKEAEKRIMALVAARHDSSVDRIYSKEMFANTFSYLLGDDTELSAVDIEVFLIFLSRDQNSILYDGKTIKFKAAGDKTTSITQEDGTIASLKTIISNFTAQVTSLEGKIKDLTLAAQNALNNKNRISALSALRSKKLAEKNLKQRSDTLFQLEEVYAKIEQAADQVDIVRVMAASTGVLQSLNAQTGGIKKVEDVVEELRREMDNVDEIGNIMNETAPVIDEGELDDELEAMVAEERETQDAEITRQRLAELDKAKQEAIESQRTTISNSELDESIDKLSQMSIEDGSAKSRLHEKELNAG